ncbi:VOC family protein [Nostoc sp. 106C]|jgi:extradiol dioxygenase family protein|uniref:VOC family protein n=1 Tax=Nostoc sp. 106C TaxID=1932667 RepID=UPI000A38AE52|nr:VOC family protein [Nostoc sp. 106C]OUL19615.1 glyoxalase [Nostoc sp. RF31YmG]OUL26184.1 glyoxalase [Nostoc sp. 106C]
MKSPENVFHLAIPCKELEETVDFYVNKLDCQLARRYSDRATFNFFGEQLVCHLSPEKIDQNPQIYPRHFGITFKNKSDFEYLLNLVEQRQIVLFQKLMVRFANKPEEHITFFLKDPSNNLLEFKYYLNSEMMY